MSYFSSASWGPISTPKAIKWLIVATCLIATATAAVQDVFDLLGVFPGPQSILSLSWWGLRRGFLWEPLSFLFIQESTGGLNLSFFFLLLFYMYVLWIVGSNLVQVISQGPFLRLYLLGGMSAGLIALLSMLVTGHHEMISGLLPALLVIATTWVMAFPETEILLFFLIPFKAKWIVAGAFGALILTTLAKFELSFLVLYLAAIAIGYGYAGVAWGWPSPFPITKKFDVWLAQSGLTMRRRMPRWGNKQETPDDKNHGKVIDITTSEPYKDDNAFVDAMLAKISKHGENSLSWSEKRRLQKISETKMQDKR